MSLTIDGSNRALAVVRRPVTLLILAAAALLSACGGPGGGGSSLAVTPASVTVAVGGTTQLTASLGGTPTTAVTWSSDTPAVATVSASGLLTGVSAGTAQVSAALASNQAVRASATVTVETPVAGRPGELISIDGGMTHTVALDANGTVWTWGANFLGQLGVGAAPIQSQAPLAVGLTDVVAIASGDHFSLALRSDGTVWAWGSNGNQQLGVSGADGWQATPVQVAGVSDAIDVAAAGSTGMALLNGGTVTMWGANFGGVLGRQSFEPTESAVPEVVPDVTSATAVALGGTISQAHALVLLTDGTVMAWGGNGSAALGQPTSTPANPSATAVPGVTGVSQVAAGQSFSLALSADGTVRGWGAANVGQLGAGNIGAFSQTPVAADVVDVVALTAGQQHAVALHENGSLSTWGSNNFGQLGVGESSGFRLSPQELAPTGRTFVGAGVQFSFALDSNGLPWAWGNNGNLQLGLDAGSDTTSPRAIW